MIPGLGGKPMRRREFIALLGSGLAAWPLAARAQQAMPMVGFLASQLPDAVTDRLRGFRQGLKDTGYVEGENVAIVYRFAENQDDRLPALAAELVSRHVAVIATAGLPPTLVAKAATTTIPIVFLARPRSAANSTHPRRNYIHRSMARRTRIEYSATHMMSEAQPRLSSVACSPMVNSPWRSNAMAPALAQSACHQTDGRVLGTNLNSSE